MRSAMDVLSDSIQRLEENGRRMLAEIERLTAERDEALAAMSADTADVVLAKCAAEARIEAALALYNASMEIPPLVEQMVKALRGEK